MEEKFKIICLAALVLMAVILPATAIPSVIDSGVSTYGNYQELVAAKDTWKTSEEGKTPDGNIAAWIRIPPKSDIVGSSYYYYQQYRIFTPDGKDWFKDIVGVKNTYNVGSSKVVLTEPLFFRGVDSRHQDVGEYGGALLDVTRFQPRNYPGKTYQFQGQWTVEIYIHDTSKDPRQSTLVKTLYFSIVDDSAQPPSQTTTPPYTYISEEPTPYITKQPYTTITTKVTPPSGGTTAYIYALDYISADVRKTGAEWDGKPEKCPTWWGNDWSGTGDYYLSHGGDTLSYSFTVPEKGTYAMWLRDWSDTNHAKGDRQVTITIDGATIGSFDAASSFNKGTTGYGWDKLTNVDLSAGSHTLKITKKDTTSSAAIIDALLFTGDLAEVPQGSVAHSTELCAATSTTTPKPGITSPVCTPPICPSGKGYVCLQKDNCPGGCGMSCAGTNVVVPFGVSFCSGTGPVVYVEDRVMEKGRMVTIPVMMCNAQDVANMDLTVTYDTSVLSFSGAAKGSLNANSLFESNEPSRGTIKISFASSSGFSGTGSIALLTFNVIGPASSNTPIKVSITTASTSAGKTLDIPVTAGNFKVGTPLTGDFDGDNQLTARDALAALQISVGKRAMDTSLDVNKDNSVNSVDAREILKMVVKKS